MHVLIADDDRNASARLEMHLRACGHTVTTVADGRAALRAVRRNPRIDAAVLNWLMPGMDGWRVARRIKASVARPVRTIVLVGGAFREDVRRHLAGCADVCLAKEGHPRGLEAGLLAATRRLARMEVVSVAYPPRLGGCPPLN